MIKCRSNFEGSWVSCGDFDVTRFVTERANSNRHTEATSEFSDCINELDLVDPPLFGGSYTWRRGENRLIGAMSEFSNCINELGVIDPPLFGGAYTWRRGEILNSGSRIDRFLHPTEWEETFSQVKQTLYQDWGKTTTQSFLFVETGISTTR